MVRGYTLELETRGEGQVVDLTDDVVRCIDESGISDGTVSLFVPGSTAGLTTIEFEPGAVADLAEVFESLAPSDRDWRHHERWGDHNGHSHVRAALLGPSLSVPFVDGELALGTWQQVVLVDFDDRPRDRRIIVQIVGE